MVVQLERFGVNTPPLLCNARLEAGMLLLKLMNETKNTLFHTLAPSGVMRVALKGGCCCVPWPAPVQLGDACEEGKIVLRHFFELHPVSRKVCLRCYPVCFPKFADLAGEQMGASSLFTRLMQFHEGHFLAPFVLPDGPRPESIPTADPVKSDAEEEEGGSDEQEGEEPPKTTSGISSTIERATSFLGLSPSKRAMQQKEESTCRNIEQDGHAEGQEEGQEEGGGVSADDAPILATARAQLGELQLRRAKAKGKGKGVSRNYTEPPADLLEPIEAEAAVDAMKGAALYLTKLCVEREAVGGLYRADGAEGVLVAERAVRLWSQIAATHEQLAAQGAGGGRLYRTKPEDQQEHRAAAVEAYCSMVEAARAGYGAGSSTNAKASRQYGDACMRLGPAADIGWAASFAPAQQAYRAHLQASHVLCAHYGKHDPRHIHASARAKSAKRAMAKGARNQSGEMGAGSGGPSDGAEDALDLSGDLAFLD
jgi:hypothetical protein